MGSMTDLSRTNALADADIDRQTAERIATESFDAIHDNVATKGDVELVRADLQRVEAALKADSAAVRAEIRADLAALEHRLIVHGIRALVVLAGLVLAAIRYLPHS